MTCAWRYARARQGNSQPMPLVELTPNEGWPPFVALYDGDKKGGRAYCNDARRPRSEVNEQRGKIVVELVEEPDARTASRNSGRSHGRGVLNANPLGRGRPVRLLPVQHVEGSRSALGSRRMRWRRGCRFRCIPLRGRRRAFPSAFWSCLRGNLPALTKNGIHAAWPARLR